MIIRDKQDLRKCVKQCVRRAPVIETHALHSVIQGEYGIDPYLSSWRICDESLQETFERVCDGSPLDQKAFSLIAALDALQLPAHDLDKAESLIRGYRWDEYLNAVLSALRAKRVLVRVGADADAILERADERIVPVVEVGEEFFEAGRYGVDYESAAGRIARAARSVDTFDIALNTVSESALKYCLIPVCEDEHLVLHICAENAEQMNVLVEELCLHSTVRAIISVQENNEREMISKAVALPNVLVQLRDTANIPYALQKLGTRFIPYACNAVSPEEMLGGWIYAKEALWQALYEAYLPLARMGYELTRERIEADVEKLLCGNYENIHKW